MWKILNNMDDLNEIDQRSVEKPQLLFKHSTRCSISSMAKNRLDLQLDMLTSQFDCYYLDLIQYRSVSNEITSRYGVEHESPQVIVVKKGKAVYDVSHHMIKPDVIISSS
jgi:bacillithiol system protein YtxJ